MDLHILCGATMKKSIEIACAYSYSTTIEYVYLYKYLGARIVNVSASF